MRIVYSDERSQLITKSLAIIVTIVFFISLIATPPLYPARASEPYLADDMAVSLWLASSSVETSVIAIDADIDPTATWVQAYSQKPLFLYRADYAIEVASPPYRYFYENASYLFNNPFSPDVIQIARNFNLSYVIAHGHAVEAFSLSPFFEPVYLTSSAVVFRPRIIATYGVVTSASGYYVTMTSGRKAVVLTRINIAIQTNNIRNFTLPIYGQVAIRPLPSTAFVASVDAHNSTEFTVPNNSVIDTCPGLAKLFKLQEIGLGGLRFVNVTLGPGLHTLTITMTSDVGFAIYVEDLKVQGISIDPSLLTLVTNN